MPRLVPLSKSSSPLGIQKFVDHSKDGHDRGETDSLDWVNGSQRNGSSALQPRPVFGPKEDYRRDWQLSKRRNVAAPDSVDLANARAGISPAMAKETAMAPLNYFEVGSSRRWDRIARNLVIASAAALFGVAAGGATMFAIVTALTPPSMDVHASAQAFNTAGEVAPVIRTVTKPASPSPMESDSNPTSEKVGVQTPLEANVLSNAATPRPQNKMPAETEIVPPPEPLKPWPDALSRARHPAQAETPRPVQSELSPLLGDTEKTSERKGGSPSARDNGVGDGKPLSPRVVVVHPKSASSNLSPRFATSGDTTRHLVVTPPTGQPPPDENLAELPPESTRGLFDFFGNDHFSDRQDAMPGMDIHRGYRADLQEKPARVRGRGLRKPLALLQIQPDEANISTQPTAGTSRPRRAIVEAPQRLHRCSG